MKREKTIIVLITLLFSFVFFSCNDKSSNIKNESASFWIDSIVNNYGNGRIYGEKPVRYIDYDTMKSTVLCSKPNCTHQSSDCIANIIGDTPMLTENGIYFFNTVVEFEESNNGNRKQVINSKLCKVSLDSSEIKDVAEFNDCAPREYDGYVLYDNKIFFTADDLNPTEDEYGMIMSQNVGGKHFICSIDLNNGEYTNYGEVYCGKNSEKDSAAIIEGLYDSKLIISYQYRLDPNSDKNDVLMFEFDPEKHTIKQIEMPMPTWVTADSILYYDDKKNKTVIIKKDETKEYDIRFGYIASTFNNKLFDRDNGVWYDLNDLSKHNMKKYQNYMVIDYYDNNYILIRHTDTVKLTEEELIALDNE